PLVTIILDWFFFVFSRLCAPISTLFPYTTLFRSALQLYFYCFVGGWAGRLGYFMLCCKAVYVPLTWNEVSLNVARSLLVTVNRRSEEHTSELQSRFDLVCRLLLEKKKNNRFTQQQ